MRIVYLNRFEKSDQGTVGIWSCPEIGFACYLLELPWRNNMRKYSCIPTGEYMCVSRYSKKYGYHYLITGVDGRTWILLHTGNLAGDVLKGYKTHSLGCLLPGLKLGYLAGQRAVLNSRLAKKKFMRLMNNEPFKLKVA